MPRAFFERGSVEVAVSLLGSLLVSDSHAGMTCGRIVEVEAYGDADDLASHAARLKSGGVRVMSGPAGIAYVYRSYGLHTMFNVVAKCEGGTGAVLIRALEPVEGIGLMRARRGSAEMRSLCSGPGKLCTALGISLDQHGIDVTENDRLWITSGPPPRAVLVGARIGISRATELPWRFFDGESAYISAHRRGELLTTGFTASNQCN